MLRSILLAMAISATASAQFWARLINPDVQVTLNHPPSLGLKITRIAFLPVGGANTQDLISALTTDLSASGKMEILDRANFDAILKEQSLGESGYIDPATVTRLGKLLGAAALVTVSVPVCKGSQVHLTNDQSYTDKNGAYHRNIHYISKTSVQFIASIQVTDLTTGKIYKSQRVVLDPSLSNESEQGYPEYPDELQVREAAINAATGSVHRMFLPWTEAQKLIFFDDKDYGMKGAYQSLEAQNVPAALEKAQASLAAAKADAAAKPKYLARVNYNLGMVYFIEGDYDSAKPYLQAALEINPKADIFQQSFGNCQRALQLRQESQQVDDRTEAQRRAEAEAQSQATAPAPAAAAAPAAAPVKTASNGGGSAEDRLAHLKVMLKKGLITKHEYEQKRAEIIKTL